MTSHPDEGTLHAFIDGELPQAEAAELERHVAACAQCASAVAETRGLAAAASRVVSSLDNAPASASHVPAGTVAPVAAARPRRRSYVATPYLRVAAVLLVAVGSAVVLDRAGSPNKTVPTNTAPTEPDALSRAGDQTMVAVPESAEVALSAPAPALGGVGVGSTGAQAMRQNARSTRRAPEAANLAETPAIQDANVAQGEAREAPAEARVPEPVGLTTGKKEFVAPTVASPPPFQPSLPAEFSAVVTASRTGRPDSRTTRYRLESGVILTLVEEPLDTVQLRVRATMRPSNAPAARTMAASSADTARINSHRWTNQEVKRMYQLSGPVSEEELKAAAIRLGDLQRVP